MKNMLAAMAIAALAASLAVDIDLIRRDGRKTAQIDALAARLHAVENAIRQRDAADPLNPAECPAWRGTGDARDHPCQTTLARLLQAPQQFQGRWVMVEGGYRSAFEESALYPPNYARPGKPQDLDRQQAIWIEPGFDTTSGSISAKVVIGKFKRGPSGHLGIYAGELTDTVEVPSRAP